MQITQFASKELLLRIPILRLQGKTNHGRELRWAS
jgi:hypothetical protein